MVSESIRQLLDIIDDSNGQPEWFRLNRITVEPDKNNERSLKVSAFDANGKPYSIAMYVTIFTIIADGY